MYRQRDPSDGFGAPRSSLLEYLVEGDTIEVRQNVDLVELFGYEVANSYSILGSRGQTIGFAAERASMFTGFLGLQMFGHWRSFTIPVFDNERQLVVEARHPFRFFFSRMTVVGDGEDMIGAVQLQLSLLSKKFRLEAPDGARLLQVRSPIWRPWTFKFVKNGEVAAVVRKRWSGVMKEAFTDADRFQLSFESRSLSLQEKLLLLVSALFIDIQYFEAKAKRKRS